MEPITEQFFVYKPSAVANTFLLRAKEDGVFDIDQLKIQKLVYNLHGWHLAVTDEPAVGEMFEAWPMGPVLSSLYQKFKSYGKSKIDRYAKDIDPQTGEEKALAIAPSDERFYKIFNAVWARYKNFSGLQLSALTHAEGTPWSKARASGLQYIDDDDIREHFIGLASKAA